MHGEIVDRAGAFCLARTLKRLLRGKHGAVIAYLLRMGKESEDIKKQEVKSGALEG
jgi:hypothetical protein